MRESYKVKAIRISDKTWSELKKKKQQSNKSWNLFLVDLMKKNGKKI